MTSAPTYELLEPHCVDDRRLIFITIIESRALANLLCLVPSSHLKPERYIEILLGSNLGQLLGTQAPNPLRHGLWDTFIVDDMLVVQMPSSF